MEAFASVLLLDCVALDHFGRDRCVRDDSAARSLMYPDMFPVATCAPANVTAMTVRTVTRREASESDSHIDVVRKASNPWHLAPFRDVKSMFLQLLGIVMLPEAACAVKRFQRLCR